MSTKTEALENTSVSHWLAELHMECYKKNLEHLDTVKVSRPRVLCWYSYCSGRWADVLACSACS